MGEVDMRTDGANARPRSASLISQPCEARVRNPAARVRDPAGQPDALVPGVTSCLTGLAVVDSTRVQVTDSCTGLLVELARVPGPKRKNPAERAGSFISGSSCD